MDDRALELLSAARRCPRRSSSGPRVPAACSRRRGPTPSAERLRHAGGIVSSTRRPGRRSSRCGSSATARRVRSGDDPNTAEPENGDWTLFAQDERRVGRSAARFGSEQCASDRTAACARSGPPAAPTPACIARRGDEQVRWGVICDGADLARLLRQRRPGHRLLPARHGPHLRGHRDARGQRQADAVHVGRPARARLAARDRHDQVERVGRLRHPHRAAARRRRSSAPAPTRRATSRVPSRARRRRPARSRSPACRSATATTTSRSSPPTRPATRRRRPRRSRSTRIRRP